MMRILVFLVIFFNFSFSLEVHKPLFPNGEKIKKDFLINNPDNPINSLISDNGKFIITIENEYFSKIRFWDIKTKNIIFQKKNIDSHSKQLALTKDDRYLLYDNSLKLILFDVQKKRIRKILKLKEYVEALDISEDGRYIAFATSKKFNLYDMEKDKIIYKLKRDSFIKQVKISKNNSFIILLTNKVVQLIDLDNSEKKYIIPLNNINKIDISKNEKFIVAISNNTIYKFNILDKKIEKIETKGSLKDVKISNEGYIITSGDSYFYGIHIWNIETKQNIFTINSTGSIKNISLSKDGKYLVATDGYTNDLFLINLFSLDIINLNRLRKSKKVLYSEKYNRIFSIDNQKGIKIWNLKKHKLEAILDDNITIHDFSLSMDNQLLVTSNTADFQNIIKIWDLNNSKNIFSFEDKNIWNISDISISKNNNLIAYLFGYSKQKIRILDVNKSKVINTIDVADNYINNLSFLNNKYIILSSYDNIKVIDIESGKIVNKINEKNQQYFSIHSNKNFYSIRDYSTKHTIEIRDILTNKKVFFTKGTISDIVKSLVFIDEYVEYKIWDLREKKYIRKLKKPYYKVDAFKDKIALYNLNNNKIVTNIYLKMNNHWLIEDVSKKKVYRYMNEKFFLNLNTFKPIFSKKSQIKKKNIDVFLPKDSLNLINNQEDMLKVQLENLTNKPIYNIDFMLDDNNFSISNEEIVFLNSHEQKEIILNIKFNNFIDNSFSKNINLEVLMNGIKQVVPLKISLIKSDQKEVEVESLTSIQSSMKKDNNNFEIKINNLKNYDLKNLEATIFYHNKIIKRDNLYIEANSSKTVSFRVDKNISKDGFFNILLYKFYDNDFNITLQPNLLKIYNFQKSIENSFEDFYFLLMLFIFFPLVTIHGLYTVLYLKQYNRNIKKIENNPSKIYEIPFNKLLYYKKILKRRLKKYRTDIEEHKRLKEILDNDFDRVINFFKVNNEEKANIFAKRAKGKLKKIDNSFFEIQLSQNFELPLDSFMLYFTNSTDIDQIYNVLKDKRANAIIVIGQNEKEQKNIHENNQLVDLPNVIGLSPKDLKIFLLKKEHTKSLAQIFATKIDRTLISPYLPEGQIENELYFFGREKIIENIYNKELSNYFIVGARQIGKSSLLKALERKFEEREDVVCITFEDTRYLLKEMATSLGLDRNSSLEEIEVFISSSSKSYLFLIDEVDAFVKKEKENGYEILHAFRALSQRKKAFFIMAGYWELFSQISFDYHSPIKNFGETIKLGKLEWKACSELITVPMENLKLDYKLVDDAVKIILQTGQRANLIAMVCDKIVKNLKPLSFEITKEDVDNALYYNDELQKTYFSWRDIPDNKRQSYIIQIIVYASVEVEYFSLESVVNLFERLGLSEEVTLDEMDESLQRLELMYIIEKNQHNVYWYTIPLMKEELMKDSKVRLNRVVGEFRRKYG